MKDKEICTCCEEYFWKSQLSLLPNDWYYPKRKYCPDCYSNIIVGYTKLHYGFDGESIFQN